MGQCFISSPFNTDRHTKSSPAGARRRSAPAAMFPPVATALFTVGFIELFTGMSPRSAPGRRCNTTDRPAMNAVDWSPGPADDQQGHGMNGTSRRDE